MKIVVVGSGLIGLTSAWFLRERGHEVVVLDRRDGPGQETSFANGSLLTPSMPEPWNAPGCWHVLLRSLGRSDAPLKLRWRALPSLARWGITFLRHSSRERFEENTLKNLELALYSLGVMQALRTQTGLEYGQGTRGTLKIFRDHEGFERAAAAGEALAGHGLSVRRLTATESVELEPALAPIAGQLTGGLYYAKDETGDAYQFCKALAQQAQARGVEFRFGTAVSAVKVRDRQVTGLHAGGRCIVADRYVIAAGSYTTRLLGRIGMRVPVRPVKGYSVTLSRQLLNPALRIPIVDDDLHAAVVPFGSGLRIAGTAEFSGYDLTIRPERVRNLVTLLKEVFPRENFDSVPVQPWCGVRPVSADGVPIIGGTRCSNLYLSTGHGHLGWTMAAGSAHLLTDLIEGRDPALDSSRYALSRFAS